MGVDVFEGATVNVNVRVANGVEVGVLEGVTVNVNV